MADWSNFFVAIVSAAAALTGLIFVGVSISLEKIIGTATLTGRASLPLVLLLVVLIISAICLVPGQSPTTLGMECFVISIIAHAATLRLSLSMLKKSEARYKGHYRLNLWLTQLALLPFVIAGIVIWANGFTGVYILVPGIILSLSKSLLDAWVLLIEINR